MWTRLFLNHTDSLGRHWPICEQERSSASDRWLTGTVMLQFEMRYEEAERARAVFERYVEILPSVKAWVRYAKFEMTNGNVGGARTCYERALEAMGEDAHNVSGSYGPGGGGVREEIMRAMQGKAGNTREGEEELGGGRGNAGQW